MGEASWVGLDVHARSVVAGVIDAGSGEVRSLRLPPGGEATVAWLQTLPAPVRVVYEAGGASGCWFAICSCGMAAARFPLRPEDEPADPIAAAFGPAQAPGRRPGSGYSS